MKIVVAPDSFKGCLRAWEVCEAVRDGILSVVPDAEVICVPMADGGEGTVDSVLRATGGELVKTWVTGPLGDQVEAEFCVAGGRRRAVMEMASASGIELVPRERLNPLEASTYGTGELLKAILDRGIREITIGIGGSATVDGGAGMAQALGFKLLDADGHDIPHGGKGLASLKSIDASGADPRLAECQIKIASDVTNPLLGPNGAARVFGPQKGATPAMVEELEEGLRNLASVWALADCSRPGDGAAGGLGAGLRAFCGAKSVSGATLLIELNRLDEKLVGADLLITGEGRTDSQTGSGKLCAVIAQTAHAKGVRVVLLSGAVQGSAADFKGMFDAAFSVAMGPCSLDEALAAARENLYFSAASVAGLLSS